MTYNTSDLIPNKVRRLHLIVARHQEIVLQTPGKHREHQIPSRLHRRIARSASPYLEPVSKHDVFGRRFLVFGVARLEETFRPRVPMVPVKGSKDWEVVVTRARIRDVAHQRVDPIAVLGEPGGVYGANDSRSVDKVAIMEVVIVVKRVTKVGAAIASSVGGGRDDSGPVGIVK